MKPNLPCRLPDSIAQKNHRLPANAKVPERWGGNLDGLIAALFLLISLGRPGQAEGAVAASGANGWSRVARSMCGMKTGNG